MLICRLAPVAMALCAQAALLPPPAVRGEPLRLERASRRGVARAAPCMTTRPPVSYTHLTLPTTPYV